MRLPGSQVLLHVSLCSLLHRMAVACRSLLADVSLSAARYGQSRVLERAGSDSKPHTQGNAALWVSSHLKRLVLTEARFIY